MSRKDISIDTKGEDFFIVGYSGEFSRVFLNIISNARDALINNKIENPQIIISFVGGMLIAETHYKHQVEADLIPFRDLFLALFFVTIGMQIDVNFFIENIVSIVFMIITPFILKNIPAITNRLLNKTTEYLESAVKEDKLNDHILVCGYGSFGHQIVSNLKEEDTNHIAILNNYDFFEKALQNGEHVVFGDPTQKNILLEAGLMKAKAVVIAVHDVETISLISHVVQEARGDIPVIAKVTKKEVFDPEVNTQDFIDVYSSTAKIISDRAIGFIKL